MQTFLKNTIQTRKSPISSLAFRILFLSLGFQFIALTPSSRAMSFTTGSTTTNPYFFDGVGGTSYSSWSLYLDDTPISGNWGNFGPDAKCSNEKSYPCVSSTGPSSVLIESSIDAFESTYWVSSTAGIPQGYRVLFNASLTVDGDPGEAVAGWAIITGAESYATANYTPISEGSTSFTYIPEVASNQRIVFKVENKIYSGSLSISNFGYSPVPGPLPAAGAATAFGVSRRLRRRIKGELPPGSRKRPAPTHPSRYLNLSPSALHGLPATFSYTAMPHRPTVAHSFPSRHGLPAMSPAPALEPAANDNTAIQA